jgi:c-di-GMP-binding flagellar brake protein YcgR
VNGFFEAIRMDLKQNRFGADDRRKHTRYQLSVPVLLSMTDHPTIQGLTIEISEGGFGATISTLLEVGHRVFVTPFGYDAMLAVVRWIRGRVYGFEFLELSSEQEQMIRNHCRKLPLHCSGLEF